MPKFDQKRVVKFREMKIEISEKNNCSLTVNPMPIFTSPLDKKNRFLSSIFFFFHELPRLEEHFCAETIDITEARDIRIFILNLNLCSIFSSKLAIILRLQVFYF